MNNPTPVDDILRAAGLMNLGSDPPLAALEEASGRLMELLADISPLRRVVIREGAIQALSEAGVRAPAHLKMASWPGNTDIGNNSGHGVNRGPGR